MERLLLAGIRVVLWVFATLTALGGSSVHGEPFRTGVIIPLTGPLAEYGGAISNGITLARETRPELFSSCEFTIEDSAYKTTQALSAFHNAADYRQGKSGIRFWWSDGRSSRSSC